MIKDKNIQILKKDGVGVIPTDTLYGIVGLAFSKEAVEKIYKIKGRSYDKPFIILISSLYQLDKFSIRLGKEEKEMIKQYWPGRTSIIFSLEKDKQRLKYLHRGQNSLAFRLPDDLLLQDLLEKTGPLVAPSANPEGKEPASDIQEAKKYFADKIDFYEDGGDLRGQPSRIIRLENGQITILR